MPRRSAACRIRHGAGRRGRSSSSGGRRYVLRHHAAGRRGHIRAPAYPSERPGAFKVSSCGAACIPDIHRDVRCRRGRRRRARLCGRPSRAPARAPRRNRRRLGHVQRLQHHVKYRDRRAGSVCAVRLRGIRRAGRAGPHLYGPRRHRNRQGGRRASASTGP